MSISISSIRQLRSTALLVALCMILQVILAGCSGKSSTPPPVDDTRSGSNGAPMNNAPQQNTGMSMKKKVVILAGAALLYYLYKHHQQQNGQNVQYYKSESTGRIYYRDPKTHQAHWVTPAPNYQVDEQEARDLSQYQGYNNNNQGRDYGTRDNNPAPAAGR